ncbi:sensor histidine kinase [Kitasatospora sp. NBC_00039]|uniref:sensor histidine kinase n=1 Tax=Kitasatospora sp. NBC_00039 TaxID=2903565 RepID=UPI0032464CDF
MTTGRPQDTGHPGQPRHPHHPDHSGHPQHPGPRPPATALLGWYAPDRRRWAETLLLLTVLALAAEETYTQWVVTDAPCRPLRTAAAALAALSLVLARRHPVASAVLPVVTAGLLNRAFPGLFSVYYLASTGRAGPAMAGGAVIAVLSAVRADSLLGWAGTTGSQLLVEAAALSLGLWLHGRRVLIHTLHAQVDALRRERELRAEQARSAERARIAREMHDVLAHRLSLLVLHAGVLRDQAAAGTAADDPDRLAHRLELLRSTAACSLDDLRDVLGVLRSEPRLPDAPPHPAATPYAPDERHPTATPYAPDERHPPNTPQPPDEPRLPAVPTLAAGLRSAGRSRPLDRSGPLAPDPRHTPAAPAPHRPAEAVPARSRSARVPEAVRTPVPAPVPAPALRDLTELVGEAAAAGQTVELALDGDPETVPTTHRLAVHRLVQEALTNARKYAYAAPVTVRVRYGAPATTVEVCNGPGRPAPSGACTGGGYGLVGLAERVGALGGHLDAGTDGHGGFRLAARLPSPERPPTPPPRARQAPQPHTAQHTAPLSGRHTRPQARPDCSPTPPGEGT